MAIPISLQLYTLRQAIEKVGYAPILESVAGIGYGHVEMAGLYNRTPQEIRQALDHCGLKPTGSHVNLLDTAARSKIEDEARILGYSNLITSISREVFDSPDKIRQTAEQVNAAIQHFAPRGFTVALHNHWWEFNGPGRGDLLLELCPQVCLEVDIYWVKTGGNGADPAETIRRYSRRTRLLHVKDGPADSTNPQLPMTAVGQGSVDVPSAIRAAEYAAVEYLVVELDHCATDMLQAVRDSYNYLTQRSLAQGRR